MPDLPDAMILCGGAGLRLREVLGSANPKSMAKIGARPFLELLLRQLQRNGFRRVLLAAGHQHQVIRESLGETMFGVELVYSVEPFPAGTGGALRYALELLESDAALVLNGDSYTDADLTEFIGDYHRSKADASVVVVPPDGRVDCGTVGVEGGWVARFREKQGIGNEQVNAGIYLISRQLVAQIPGTTQLSLELDLFPQWLAEGRRLRAFTHSGTCIDIGTPDRYRNAQENLANAEI